MTEYKQPDLKAPRFRKGRSDMNFWDLTLALKKKYPGKYDHINQRDFKKVIVAFHQNIQEEVINNRDGIEFPEYMGMLKLVSIPSFKEWVNIPESKRLGQVVTHKNWETDGYNAKIFYSSNSHRYLVANRRLWQFDAVRQFKRLVSREYPLDWKKYEIYDSMGAHVAAGWHKDKHRRKAYAVYQQILNIDTYNEFDMN